MSVDGPGTFELHTGPDMAIAGQIGDRRVTAAAGSPISVPLPGGSHAIDLHATSTGDRWQLVPLWNGRDGWAAARLTASAPGRLDRFASAPAAFATTAIVLLLIAGWIASAVSKLELSRPLVVWSGVASVLFLCLGIFARFERSAGLLLLGSAFVPVARRGQNVRTAFVLVGYRGWRFLSGTRGRKSAASRSTRSATTGTCTSLRHTGSS